MPDPQFCKRAESKADRSEKGRSFRLSCSGEPTDGQGHRPGIISPDFGHNRLKERTMLLQLAWRIYPRLEPIAIRQNLTKVIPGYR